jgi:hypothetical protein
MFYVGHIRASVDWARRVLACFGHAGALGSGLGVGVLRGAVIDLGEELRGPSKGELLQWTLLAGGAVRSAWRMVVESNRRDSGLSKLDLNKHNHLVSFLRTIHRGGKSQKLTMV